MINKINNKVSIRWCIIKLLIWYEFKNIALWTIYYYLMNAKVMLFGLLSIVCQARLDFDSDDCQKYIEKLKNVIIHAI